MNSIVKSFALVMLCFCCVACQSAYFAAMEKVGYHKRDILISRVEDAREAQQEIKEQFQSALEAFSALTDFDGGDLEDKYNDLKDVLERSEEKAQLLGERIDAVEDVAEALFDEWNAELDQYTSVSMRRSSEQQLQDTQRRSKKLITSMRSAEAKIEPVLIPLRDQVLYLKHNLNARAVAALRSELSEVQNDVARLVKELEQAVNEADSFISELEAQQ
jgi:predicted nuclease with TOPRIM domain